jgi:hypothetical protein
MSMDTATGPRPANEPRTETADPISVDWMLAHGKSRYGWERHTIPLALFDLIPPSVPRPALLLANLKGGEVLPLRRLGVTGSTRPDFRVTSTLGRDLGLLGLAPFGGHQE